MITTSEVAVSLTIDNDTHLKEINMPLLPALSVLKWGLALATLVGLVAFVVLFVVTRIESLETAERHAL